jgi:hypothetical protein
MRRVQQLAHGRLVVLVRSRVACVRPSPVGRAHGPIGFPGAGGISGPVCVRPSPRHFSLLSWVLASCARPSSRETLLLLLWDGCRARGPLRRRRRRSRDGSSGIPRRFRADVCSAASRVRGTEDREGPRSGNEDGLATRRPLNGDHATPDVGHDAVSGRLFHLGAHHLNLVTDLGRAGLLRTLVRPIRRSAVLIARNLDEIASGTRG